MRYKYQSRSFGVLEIVLSVAILAVFSVFVLQLFLSASNNSKKVKLTDNAQFQAISIVEKFKGSNSPLDFCKGMGLSQTAGDDIKQNINVSDNINAEIEIKKDSETDAGILYVINIDMRKIGSNESLVSLRDVKFFSKV
jgi:type II secretory pathway pseudopilin PulG